MCAIDFENSCNVQSSCHALGHNANARSLILFDFLGLQLPPVMSISTNKPFSRLWNRRSRSNTHPPSPDIAADATSPFAELASGSEPIPTTEERARIRYYHSKMTVRDADFVVRRGFFRVLRS